MEKLDKLSLYDLYRKKSYFLLPVGEGEMKSYPALLWQAMLDCGEELRNFEGRHFLFPPEVKEIKEITEKAKMFEDEFLKITRFGLQELPSALKEVTSAEWEFAHRQKYNTKTREWELKLSIQRKDGRFFCDFFTYSLEGGIFDIKDVEEIKTKIKLHHNEDDTATKVYLETGDPQLSFDRVSHFTWKPFASALQFHLQNTYVNMDIYNSFGQEKFCVFLPKEEDASTQSTPAGSCPPFAPRQK